MTNGTACSRDRPWRALPVKMLERPVVVTCHLGPAQDLFHLSKVLNGLWYLGEAGQIVLCFTTVCETSCISTAEAALHVFVTHEGGTLHVVFDAHDKSDSFETTLLEHCDFYFKRSFRASDI